MLLGIKEILLTCYDGSRRLIDNPMYKKVLQEAGIVSLLPVFKDKEAALKYGYSDNELLECEFISKIGQ